LAAQGIRPVVAVYSSFLQRAYDQIIEEIALQNAAVVLAIDRAGIVGGDGVTHQGIFDIAFLRNLPNFVVMAPKDGEELGEMLEFALTLNRPVSIRYPKDKVQSIECRAQSTKLQLGKAEVLREGKDFAIIALGSMVAPALEAIELLEKEGLFGTLINARFVKPLDTILLETIANRNKFIFTVEEGVEEGGFGSAVMEATGAPIIRIGLPCEFITHGKREILLDKYGLTAQGIAAQIKMRLSKPGEIEKPAAKWQK
jgi:1-deoxy-D-xylulose-5-phosphate synthase